MGYGLWARSWVLGARSRDYGSAWRAAAPPKSTGGWKTWPGFGSSPTTKGARDLGDPVLLAVFHYGLYHENRMGCGQWQRAADPILVSSPKGNGSQNVDLNTVNISLLYDKEDVP